MDIGTVRHNHPEIQLDEWTFSSWCRIETMNLFSPLSGENKWLEAVRRIAILFSVIIPLIGLIANCCYTPRERTKVDPVSPKAAILAEANKFSPRLILHADDDQWVRDIVSMTFESFGHTIVSAGSVDEALELFDRQTFDCVITDFHMGEKTGVDLADALRGGKRNYRGGILLLTGEDTEAIRTEAAAHGIDDCYGKGKSLAVLQKKMETVIQARKDLLKRL